MSHEVLRDAGGGHNHTHTLCETLGRKAPQAHIVFAIGTLGKNKSVAVYRWGDLPLADQESLRFEGEQELRRSAIDPVSAPALAVDYWPSG